ncbi:MAG: sulfatase-like hydrolase/transferase [Proteobacteria bacterium]|nr:sulfatase-like hydrolase/transferase [Pseudomonadota bacterium]MBU1715650.1 sulfatase-like hydrolase/transferase [Pseudomonadota bacterium]
MKHKILPTFISRLILLMVVGTTLLSCTNSKGPSLADLTKDTGIIFPEAKSFLLQKNITRPGENRTFQTIKASGNQKLLKIEIISPIELNDARQIIKERFNIVDSLYTNLPSPYPGMLTREIEYPEKLRPEYQLVNIPSQKIPLYLLASNDRYSYGAMAEEMVTFMGFFTFIYNPEQKSLSRLDYFVPKVQYDKKEVLRFAENIRLTKKSPQIDLSVALSDDKSTAPDKQAETVEPQTVTTAGSATIRQNNLNVIIIGFEPLGSRHVGAYGYDKDTTPYLDTFAKDAFLFKNVVSPSSWTLPVFMSWFTSLYPSRHRITNKYSKVTDSEQKLANLSEQSPEVITLAEIMKAQGYQTAGFTGGAGVSSDFGYARGFDLYYDQQTFAGFDQTMPMALDWLKDHRQNNFFLFVQGYDVHGRFPLDEEGKEKFIDKEYQGKLQGTTDEYWALRDQNIDQGKLDLDEGDIKFLQSIYDAKISAADRRFGSFIKGLQEMGLLENTVIVISSGSGNEYYEHRRIDHGFSLYEELIQVPLIIRMPKITGSTKNLVRTIDIMPTILDLLKIKTPQSQAQMEGVSLQPLMKGETLELDGFAETDYLLQSFKRSITTNDGWKFIISLDTDERELYDLNHDPDEQKNVLGTNGRIAYELEQKLFSHLAEINRK